MKYKFILMLDDNPLAFSELSPEIFNDNPQYVARLCPCMDGIQIDDDSTLRVLIGDDNQLLLECDLTRDIGPGGKISYSGSAKGGGAYTWTTLILNDNGTAFFCVGFKMNEPTLADTHKVNETMRRWTAGRQAPRPRPRATPRPMKQKYTRKQREVFHTLTTEGAIF